MQPAAVKKWWTEAGFAVNARTPQLHARGILSRTTAPRGEIQNDDVEVASNVETEPARMKLRRKLAASRRTSSARGSTLYVGTPHTHDSLYDERISAATRTW